MARQYSDPRFCVMDIMEGLEDHAPAGCDVCVESSYASTGSLYVTVQVINDDGLVVRERTFRFGDHDASLWRAAESHDSEYEVDWDDYRSFRAAAGAAKREAIAKLGLRARKNR